MRTRIGKVVDIAVVDHEDETEEADLLPEEMEEAPSGDGEYKPVSQDDSAVTFREIDGSDPSAD